MNFLDRFSNIQIPNFMKIRPLEAELFHSDGLTDMKKPRVAFCNVANAPQNLLYLRVLKEEHGDRDKMAAVLRPIVIK
jgi:hypothetical protein